MLVYPNLSDNLNTPDKFEIVSGFPSNEKINVTAIDIPFWSLKNFENLEYEFDKVISINLNAIKLIRQSPSIY